MMRRRLLAGGIAATLLWPHSGRTQRGDIPVVGFLYGGYRTTSDALIAALREGAAQTGYIDGQSMHVEYRWADGRYDRLPSLAVELMSFHPAVIGATGGENAPVAAKAATSTVPIVFISGRDPVLAGLVDSLAHPSGNLTGITNVSFLLAAKRIELLHGMLPSVTNIGMMVNPNNSTFRLELMEARYAAAKLGLQIQLLQVASASNLDTVFSSLAEDAIDAIVCASDGFLFGQRERIVDLAERHAVPAIYFERQFVTAGGLMSYGSRLTDAYRQVGIYIGKILAGAKPANLPVRQLTEFELVINLRAAKFLGLAVPPSIVAQADEVIE